MDSVDIPLCSAAETIDGALGELRTKNRSGVVVESAAGYRLLHAGDLLYARERGLATLGDLDGGQPIVFLSAQHVKDFRLNTTSPKTTSQEYQTFLRSVAHRYTLLSAAGNTAMIVTASEL
jgi:hypothetical protein